MRTKIIALVRLVGLASSALSFAAGCDDGDQSCSEDEPCLDVAVLRASAVSVNVLNAGNGNDAISVQAALPPALERRCYHVPNGLVVSAAGGAPVPPAVWYDAGHTIPSAPGCPAAQYAGATLVVPAGSTPVEITFSLGGSRANLTVNRAARPPVDVALSTTMVARGAGFSADLTSPDGTLPTGIACWSAHLYWDNLERGLRMSTTAKPIASGVRIDIAFGPEVPAADLSPGGAQLFLSPSLGDGCDTQIPTVSCADFQSCTVAQSPRTLGPYHLEIL